jgi:hypothetical protein
MPIRGGQRAYQVDGTDALLALMAHLEVKFMTKEEEIMEFLHKNVFDPILYSPIASSSLKQGVQYTIMRLNRLDATGMIQYYWSAIVGTERSVDFAHLMKEEGFTRFEEVIDEFRERFDDEWLES